MNSAAMQGKKRPTGNQWRSGVTKTLLDNVYGNMDAAFLALEQAVNAGWAACACVYDAAENTNFASAAPTPIDTSVAATVGMRILVTGQTLQKNNGIYVVDTVGTGANGTWSRAEDLSSLDHVQLGDEVWVTGGTTHGNTAWRVTSVPTAWATTGNLVFTLQSAGSFVPLSLFTAVGDLAVGSGNGAASKVAVAASRIVGRKSSGSVAGLTASEARVVMATTSEADADELIGGAHLDGDRLMVGGLTAANFKAALATDAVDLGDQILKWKADSMTAAFLKKLLPAEALDFSDTDIAAAVKAATLPTSKLVVATEGQASSATAGSPSAVVVVPFTLTDVSSTVYFKADRKYELVKIQLCKTGSTGGTGDKWVFTYDASPGGAYADYLNVSAGTGISADGVAANTEPAVPLDRSKCTIASGGSIKMTGVKPGGGTSAAARGFLHLVPIA